MKNTTKNIIPSELKENNFFIKWVTWDISNDYSVEAEPYKQEIHDIIQQFCNSEIDKYTALGKIHNILVNYDYNVTIPREDKINKSCIVIYNSDDETEKFIKENFYVEQIFPTKSAIYYAIGLPHFGIKTLKGGKQKQIANAILKQYVDVQPVADSKRQQQIIDIYEIPHYKEDLRGKRGKFRDQLVPISVNWLLDKVTNDKFYEQDGETVIYTNVNELAYNFGLISADYQKITYSQLEEINPQFTPYVVSQFYYFSKPQVKSKVFSTLDVLQDDYRILSYYRNYLITTKDNKTFISDKSHDNIIRKAERIILKEMGYSSLPFLFRAKKENEFYKKVIFYINTNYKKNWQHYKQQIEIHVDNEELKEVNIQLDSKSDLNIAQRKSILANAFGESVYNFIESQVKFTSKKADAQEQNIIDNATPDIKELLDIEVLTRDDVTKKKPFRYPDYFLPTTQQLMIIMLP